MIIVAHNYTHVK